jgi:hypothetical protein
MAFMCHTSRTHPVMPHRMVTGFTGWILQLSDGTAPEDPGFPGKILLATLDALVRRVRSECPGKNPRVSQQEGNR